MSGVRERGKRCSMRTDNPRAKASPLPVQRAYEGEEPPRGRQVDADLAFEPLHQQLAAFVVQAPSAHVDGLDARRRRGLDRLEVALAHEEIVLRQAAKGRE